ncbi:hypothetical protein HOLleu_44015 [Holothuria leucospilota]|uniref:Uncharacterized protein n=1 Tax=Holothuria leucospilota TaxID=206669 RepID=A0A9Q1BB64_HOLLE|nr:hypothetical protein HOLleu_44015 [Holothuria leucospilota]
MADNLRRDFSVLLSLTGKEDVFDVLDELGVLPAEHSSGVQQRLPGNRFDVTFKSADIRRRSWPVFNSATKLTAWSDKFSYAGPTSLVTVLHVPLELDDNIVNGLQCLVRYNRQPRTCLKCSLDGHEAKTCDNRRCFKCFN